jgi:hypothetical protein
MTSDEIKQEFASALMKHLSFKARLRSFLHGGDPAEAPLRDPNQCSLGQWIAGRQRDTTARFPNLPELDQQHRRIHREANRLMDLYLAGHKEEAAAGFGAVQVLADDIVATLQTMEQKLRTGS